MFKPADFVSAVTPWIKAQVKAANAYGVVLGNSGGIDSAVVAYLCTEALGKDSVKLLWLGCESSAAEQRDAQLVADSLKIRLHLIDLIKPFDAFIRSMHYYSGMSKLTRANIKSRLRMVALYSVANMENLLVAGTGDKSEDEIGYFTKYGDGGVDFLPIADLLKTEVRELGRHLGVNEAIINKPSSPGLWPGQTAEGELGIMYEEVDKVLTGSPDALPEVITKVNQLRLASEHKRAYPPIFKMNEQTCTCNCACDVR